MFIEYLYFLEILFVFIILVVSDIKMILVCLLWFLLDYSGNSFIIFYKIEVKKGFNNW